MLIFSSDNGLNYEQSAFSPVAVVRATLTYVIPLKLAMTWFNNVEKALFSVPLMVKNVRYLTRQPCQLSTI